MSTVGRVLAWVALTPIVVLVAGIGGCEARKEYYDWQVRKMCEKDGGVTIYDRVSVTRSQFEAMGKVGGFASVPPKRLASPDAPVFSVATEIVIKEGRPGVRKREETVFRSADEEIVALVVSYWREGGDFPSFAHPSSFVCPDPLGNVAAREKLFVVTGEQR